MKRAKLYNVVLNGQIDSSFFSNNEAGKSVLQVQQARKLGETFLKLDQPTKMKLKEETFRSSSLAK